MMVLFSTRKVDLVTVPLSVVVPLKMKKLRLVCVLAKPREEGVIHNSKSWRGYSVHCQFPAGSSAAVS